MPYIDLQEAPVKELVPGYRAKIVHTATMTLVHWSIAAGAPMPEHSHSNEQVANVLAGKFELSMDGETFLLEPGVMMVIPPHARHSGVALTDCNILDVFCPIREDYR